MVTQSLLRCSEGARSSHQLKGLMHQLPLLFGIATRRHLRVHLDTLATNTLGCREVAWVFAWVPVSKQASCICGGRAGQIQQMSLHV
jgi:hypothetical protein